MFKIILGSYKFQRLVFVYDDLELLCGGWGSKKKNAPLVA